MDPQGKICYWHWFWPLMGLEWSRDLDTCFWLVECDHVTWILASDWSGCYWHWVDYAGLFTLWSLLIEWFRNPWGRIRVVGHGHGVERNDSLVTWQNLHRSDKFNSKSFTWLYVSICWWGSVFSREKILRNYWSYQRLSAAFRNQEDDVLILTHTMTLQEKSLNFLNSCRGLFSFEYEVKRFYIFKKNHLYSNSNTEMRYINIHH